MVDASAGRVYAALRNSNLAASLTVQLLLALRTGGRGLAGVGGSARSFRLNDPRRSGFGVLAEDAPYEVVLGTEGAFWSRRATLRPLDDTAISAEPAPATARAAWSFTVRPLTDMRCELATETRVLCADDNARRRFRLYWLLVRPGSGLIRRSMLRTIRRAAERG